MRIEAGRNAIGLLVQRPAMISPTGRTRRAAVSAQIPVDIGAKGNRSVDTLRILTCGDGWLARGLAQVEQPRAEIALAPVGEDHDDPPPVHPLGQPLGGPEGGA